MIISTIKSFSSISMRYSILTRFVIRRGFSSSTIDLYTRMKQLNSAKDFRQSIALFDHHQHNRMKITNGAICQALDACIGLNDIKRGKRIYQELTSQSLEDPFIRIYLIRLFMKCGDVNQAQQIYFSSKKKTIGMFDALLNGFSINNRPHEGLNLFQKLSMPPSEFTYATLFKICNQIGNDKSYQCGKMMFERMSDIHRHNLIVLTSALKMAMNMKDISMGEKIFSQMKKDMRAYGVMMSGYLANNQPQKAVDLFLQINKPDQVNYFVFFDACAQLATKEALNLAQQILSKMPKEYLQFNGRNKIVYSMLNMFIKCDDEKSAEELFIQLKKDVMSYGAMMKMYNDKEKPEKVMSLFEQIQRERIQPDKVIYLMILNACAQLGDLSLCESIVSKIPKQMFNDLWIQNGLIDMWGKSGSTDRARDIFNKILRPDIVSFSAMINAYGLNGMGSQAIEMFNLVPRNICDEWVYVCVLNACSHSGLINEALSIFQNIPQEKKTEQIYTAMVDGLGRSYLIEDAQNLIDQFERSHPPVYPMYMSMLSAARNNRNLILAKKIFDQIKNYFSQNKDCLTSAMVLLANTYALSGDMSTASAIRMKLSQTGMKRKSGISATVHNGQIVQFRAHNRSHPQSIEIYEELDRLNHELMQHGYIPDSSWVTRPPTEDESEESLLCGHSERLAIAFQLIQKPTPTRIQVTKNLRICGDCHQTIKLIAQIRQCLIIVRDANRVHHFYKNGECSCQGHF